jgi:hypothetical protein
MDDLTNPKAEKAVKNRTARATIECLYHDVFIHLGDIITVAESEALPGETIDPKTGAISGSPLNFEIVK